MSSAARCLGNALVLQKVLESFRISDQLQFRLVNKSFDRECLRQIRISHRRVDLWIGLTNGKFKLNELVIEYSQLTPCFKFLKDVARVRVEELNVRVEEEGVSNNMKTAFHTEILTLLENQDRLRVLTGMYDLCGMTCERCVCNVLRCREYGPVSITTLLAAKEVPLQRFDKLIVTEDFLNFIALFCTEECNEENINHLETINSLITARISCDHLKLVINDRYKDMEEAIPREVLEAMCSIWKVKSVEIEITVDWVTKLFMASMWTSSKLFTEFKLTSPNKNNSVSAGFKLESVKLNLLHSIYAESKLFESPLIDNIRCLFPSENYFVEGPKVCNYGLRFYRFEAIIKSVFTRSEKSAITLRYAYQRFSQEPISFEIPPVFLFDGRVFTSSISSATIQSFSIISKLFVITDKATRNVLNLEVYVYKQELNELKFEKVEHDFLSHFI